MDERQYFATINHLLSEAGDSGNIIGAYCLGFAEALHQEFGEMPPTTVMQRFVNCPTVAEGITLYALYRHHRAATGNYR